LAEFLNALHFGLEDMIQFVLNDTCQKLLQMIAKPVVVNYGNAGQFYFMGRNKYRLVDKYMHQPPAPSSGVRISRRLIARVQTVRKVKYNKLILSVRFTP
jgi:hypothetical protein